MIRKIAMVRQMVKYAVARSATTNAISSKLNIKQITEKLGYEAEIVVVHHASGFANVFRRWQNLHDTGFVGVSCVPSAVNEALNLRKMNIVSQIVFLEECSCKKHWSDAGLPTCTSIN